MNRIGENIKQARKKRGYTQKELAELCEFATITLRQYESGKRNPKIETLQKIASALGVDVTELIEIDNVHDVIWSKESEEWKNMRNANRALNEAKKSGDKKALAKLAKENPATLNYIFDDSEKILIDELFKNFKQLNTKGQQKAAEQVELLTKIPEYQKKSYLE